MRKVTYVLMAATMLLNPVGLRAEDYNPFTTGSYQLVTDVEQLSDSDRIIIGVSATGVNKVMGYFDETVSKNNIHALAGQYTNNRRSTYKTRHITWRRIS